MCNLEGDWDSESEVRPLGSEPKGLTGRPRPLGGIPIECPIVVAEQKHRRNTPETHQKRRRQYCTLTVLYFPPPLQASTAYKSAFVG